MFYHSTNKLLIGTNKLFENVILKIRSVAFRNSI